MRLLLVEDDAMIGESIRAGLRQDGHAVDWVTDGRAAEHAIRTGPYAMVLLDLGLPRKDGYAVLEDLRRSGNPVPVLILTARDAIADRVRGLDRGADDYLVKPFDLDELAARIRAVLRRHAGRAEPVLAFGALALDPTAHKVTHRGRDVPVSAREFALLQALLERPGATLSRAQLEERLYGWGEEVASNSVEVHVHNLRKKLGEAVIRTVRGVGYAVADDGGPGAPG
jgi:two-component system, OmpR family, response regulator